jgi:TorA maturation chaperone TorD
MTEPSNFVARWSRLKRGVPARGEVGPSTMPVPSATAGPDAPAASTVDPASLPPIDTITAATDIRAFLAAGVPADLARAALRRAWASDPIIRDFIEVADNQWDFTDPKAMAGFGPLPNGVDLPSLAAQAAAALDDAPHVSADNAGATMVDEVDQGRAAEYALLATLLWQSPDAGMLERLAALRGDATPLGAAHAALAEAAAKTDAERAKGEYFALFEGLGRGKLLPYASYYLTGSLSGRPLAQLRDSLAGLGIKRAEGHSEPEDHAAILCEIMADLAARRIAAPAEADREFFAKHLAPWMGRFFADLERAGSAYLYARVGTVGRTFMEIETEAFRLPASES